MKRLKLFFACLLMAVLSIGQVWAVDPTISWDFKTLQATSGTQSGITWETGKTGSANATVCNGTNGLVLYGVASGGGYFQTTSAISGTITNVNIVSTAKKNTPKYTVYCSTDGSTWDEIATAQTAGTKDHAVTGSYTYVKVANTTAATAQLGVASITVTYTPSGSSTQPTVSADPEEVEDVPVAGVTNQTIDLTYENITGYVTEVSVHPNADGTGTLSPAWLTASVSDADDYATITYTVSANDGAARTAYIKVYTTDGDKEAETIIPVSQVKYSAPTGTFALFSGDLAEGDYVITHASANAIKAEINSDRFAAIEVSPSADIITNPDESIVWHIAQSGGYWTIYNVAAGKYAASTGAKNKGALLDDGTDDKALWSLSGTYDFINKQNTASSVNATLRYNYQNALNTSWACYASGTGSALVLYKKQVAGQPATPTFSVAGGNYESAQTVEISCETVGATIHYTLDGTKPTSSSPTYSTALNISSTTTVKAVAIKDDIESTVASATYTIVVWQTVDEIWSSITSEGPTNANVWGYVSQANVGGYNNNYYISVDGSLTANQLEIYKGDNAGNTVAVGDKVHVNGDLTIFNEIKEFKQNTGVIVHYEAKGDLQSVAVSGTPTKTEYATNEDFDPAGLKVYGTYENGFVGEITDGITWGNDLTENKVTETTTVHVTATVSEIASPAYDVAVTVAAKTLLSIAVDVDSYTIYTGEALPEPTVTATFSEGEPENVSAFAVYDSESVFDTEVIDNPDPQTITVSYTFGGATQTATYTVSVKDYANADDAPYTVTEALHIITAAIGNTESAREIVVTGTVSEENISNNKNRYKISDSTNELLVYAGKGFNNENFTNTNYPKVGDVVKVKGKVINYNNNTPEFASGKSYLLSQVRPATIAIENVASFEVGATDLTESDLDITTPSDGDITFVSGDDAVATIEANAIHAVAPGTVTITANLAATENVNALNYAATTATFSVTVVPATVKYAITFDDNGKTGGTDPEEIADKAAGTEVPLPENTWKKLHYDFSEWKVYDENSNEVTVSEGKFIMPASPVTIQAQWIALPEQAYTYSSNVTLSGAKVKFYGDDTELAAVKAGTGSAAGSTSITVPAQATKVHFHAYGWNTENVGLTVTAPAGVTVSPATEISINKNSGIKDNSPFTLSENADPEHDAYYVVELSGNDTEIELTFSATSGKRFVLFGVNQEGGVVPVLQSLAIEGDLDNKTYEAGAAIDPTGLTVMGTYTLGGTPQTPVDVTDQVEDWLYDALQAGDETVTISAKIGDITSTGYEISGLTVTDPTPTITASPSFWNFNNVDQNAEVAAKVINITLNNVAAATVALSGTGASAFTLDKNALDASGTISVTPVTTTIGNYSATVTISDNAGVAANATITLLMNVQLADSDDDLTGTWTLVTDASQLAAGKKVIIAQYVSEDGVIKTMSTQTNNNRSVVESSVAGTTLSPAEHTRVMTVEVPEEGKFALKTNRNTYLYAASSSSNYLKEQNELDANGKWTITIEDNKATITATGANTHNIMKYNETSDLFSCYTGGQKDIAIYMLEESTPEPVWEELRAGATSGKYYTVCLSKNVTNFRGGNFWNMSKRNGSSIAYLEEVTTDDLPLAKGTPYIFEVTGAKMEVVYEGAETNAAGTNGALVGTFENMIQNDLDDAASDAGSDIYLLSGNKLWNVTTTGASGNSLAAGRAYIVYGELDEVSEAPHAPGKRVRAVPMQGQTATGVDAFNASETPVKMIIDGKLFILRGEKMYDATGKLVK
jgi:hypothetical protein